MTSTEMRRFVAEYTDEVWNRGNPEAMINYLDTRYVHHDPSRPDVTTLADYTQWTRDLFDAFDGLRIEVDEILADGDRVVKRWTVTGTHTGPLAGIAPTGRPVRFSGVSTYRVRGGCIAEGWYLYDALGLLRQLGALPAAAA